MIRTWKNRGLQELFTKGKSRKIDARFAKRLLPRLDQLDAAETVDDMNAQGFYLHQLSGDRKGTWAIRVSGAWRLTFRIEKGDAYDVDFEQYH